MKELSFAETLVMGIVNITPDSFFDGGKYLDASSALTHMAKLAADGADILDIGAASSRPGYTAQTAEEELRRLKPVFAEMDARSLPALSIDTDKPQVAQVALEYGFSIVNCTGLPSPEMSRLAASFGARLVLMFRGPFRTADIVSELREFFLRNIDMALAQGVAEDRLILDPGIGFDMDMEQCALLIARTGELVRLGKPLLLGMSNKRFIGAFGGGEEGNRLPGNIAAELFGAEQGAAILRVHDVAATRQALAMYRALKQRA